MNSKKAITLLVLATLLLTLVPLTTSLAITVTDVYDEVDGAPGVPTYTGVYGDTLIIVGADVTAGKNVRVYWDAVDDWDGEAGLLNSTKAKSSGAYELWFDIPEAVNGDHYLWLEDVQTGDTMVVPTPITVDAYLEADPDAGLDGDTITLNGYGFDDEVDIDITTINSTTLLVPIVDANLPTSPGTPETDEVGSWTATFKVPDFDDGYEYDDYEIYVEDENANFAYETFTIGPALTLDIDEGTVGEVVEASGRGFADGGTIEQLYIIDSDMNSWNITEADDDYDISSRGSFNKDLVMPSVDDIDDDYEIVLVDNLGNMGRADFEILGHPGVETDPEYAVQGSTVAVMGYNFTYIDGEEVTLYLGPPINDIELGTYDTDNDGEFSGTFKIPAVASDTYDIYATQDDWGIHNMEDLNSFKVGLMIVILSPDDGPTGEVVSVTASGFEPNGGYSFNISDIELAAGTVDFDGSIAESFVVPILEPGIYTVSVEDEDNEITVTAEFEVTDRAYIETTPVVAPNRYNVTIEGWFFSQDPTLESLDFLLFNDTEEWDLDVESGLGDGNNITDTTELGLMDEWDDIGDGYFRGWFRVPGSDFISVGTYTLNVTDEADLWAQYTFEVVEKTVEIDPRKATFRIGDTVNFDVISTFILDDSYVDVMTPDGSLYWQTDPFDQDDWVKVGTEQLYPYFNQIADGNLMTLLDDAPLGEWSWVWYDEDDDELDSGVFTVEESAEAALGDQITDLNNQITDLQSSVADVTSEFDTVKSDIANVAAIAQQAVTAANQAAEAVQTVAQTANQANTAAENAAEAANAAKDAANSLTTLVYGAIGAALVAALAAIVSLMQISRRIAG
jgi:hypothetical protein